MKTILIALFFLCAVETAQSKNIVWKIGESDNSSKEFALAPDRYNRFVQEDFGGEDQYYVIGVSDPKTNWPYVLPGIIDGWAGAGSGKRPAYLNILFDIADDVSNNSTFELVIDFQLVGSQNVYLETKINDQYFRNNLPAGIDNIALVGLNSDDGRECILKVDIPTNCLHKGINVITLRPVAGSWALFDQIRLESCESVKLSPPNDFVIKKIQAADYETTENNKRTQPLLLNILQLKNTSAIEVKIDNKSVFTKTISRGEYNFEISMPAVPSATQTKYSIVINNKLVKEDVISQSPQNPVTLADYVDTKIGTGHSRWMIAPGPWLPMSMVKFAPDNQLSGWQSGYDPSINSVLGFSHIHEYSMEGLTVMPSNGDMKTVPGGEFDFTGGYRARIDENSEKSPLGMYSVYFPDRKIQADITQTMRCSFGKYTFKRESVNSRIIIDLKGQGEYWTTYQKAYFKKETPNRLVGYSQNATSAYGGSQNYQVYFAIEFDKPIKKIEYYIVTNKYTQDEVYIDNGPNLIPAIANVEFETSTDTVVQMRTGISYVSIDNAKLNLQTEITTPFDWDFNRVVQANRDVWNNYFSRVKIQTSDRIEKSKFYTCFYRAVCERNTFSDVDGSYTDPRERTQKRTPPVEMYGSDAFWGTYWNLNQFWNLITPEISLNWVKSQMEMYRVDGWTARSPAGIEYLPVMVASHQLEQIISTYQMGIREGYDANTLLQICYENQTKTGAYIGGGYAGNEDLASYLQYHFVPYNLGKTSNTLEYGFDDWAVYQFAKSLGKQNETNYAKFLDRSEYWRNIFDPETKYFRMKDQNGWQWYTPFNIYSSGANSQYTEANAAQMLYFVPQNLPGLIESVGADELYNRLNNGFITSETERYNLINEDYAYPLIVNHGNQQVMHVAFIFNWLKKPWKTQEWSRSIMYRYYGYGVSTMYPGDEDQGQMSGWFCMAAMGLFQMDGGTRSNPIYEIGSPLYDRIEIDLGNKYGRGKTFTIIAKNNSKENMYVQSAKLNGVALTNFWFRASELLKGGSLELEMGNTPNENWGLGGGPTTSE